MATPARPPPTAKPSTPSSSIKAEMATVMANLANLFAMDRDGKLSSNQVIQLRQLIAAQSRQITLRMTMKQQTNPLVKLPPHLDPTVSSGGNPAIVAKEIFQAGIKYAEQEAMKIVTAVIPMPELKKLLEIPQDKRNTQLANDAALRHRFHTSVLWYTKGGADAWVMGPNGAKHVPPTGPAVSGTTTPRPPANPQSGSTNQPPVQPISHPNSNANSPAVRPPPAPKGKAGPKGTTSSGTSPASTAPTEISSTSATAGPPVVKLEQDTNPLASIPRSVAPATAIPIPPPDSSSTATTSTAGPSVPTSTSGPIQPMVPRAPVVPIEPESVRRKRKLREWLKDEGPGMEFEVGVPEVWSEVIDSFIHEAGRGAAKLAKHRGADKVGVKDISYYLKETYGITVPGFNAAVPEKVHAAPEGRRKSVLPRSAKSAKSKDEE